MAANTISILITAKDQASKVLKGLSSEVENGTKTSDRFKGALVAAGKVGATALAAGAAAATTGLIAASKAAFDQVKSVEEARFGLQAYEKDAGKVNDVLSGLVDYARSDMGVLFNRKDMFAAASTLKMYGNETESLVDRVKILSKGVSQGKTSFQELSGIVGRAAAKGRLDAVDFDMLIERGIGLDRSFRGTAISAEELWEALDEALPDELLAARAQTIEGRMIRLQSAFREVGNAVLGVDADTNEFIEGGLGDRFMKAVEGSTESLKAIAPVIRESVNWILKLSDGVSAALAPHLSAFGDMLRSSIAPALAEFGRQAWDYLGPKIQKLADVFVNDLWPALREGWEAVGPGVRIALELLAKAVGIGLVAAVGLAVDIFRVAVSVMSGVVRTATNIAEFLPKAFRAVVDFFVQAWNDTTNFFSSIPGFFSNTMTAVSTAVSNGINAVAQYFASLPSKILFHVGFIVGRLFAFATQDVPNFVNEAVKWFQQLPGRVGSAMSSLLSAVSNYFSQVGQNARQRSSDAVNGSVSWFQQLPGRVGRAVSGLWGAAVGAFNRFKSSAKSWASSTVEAIISYFAGLPGRINNSISGAFDSALSKARSIASNVKDTISSGFNSGKSTRRNAVGTAYSPGGTTLVGEHGPELVNLPKGARVVPNYQTRQMQQSDGASTISIQFLGPVSMRSDDDVRSLGEQINKQQRLASRGIA